MERAVPSIWSFAASRSSVLRSGSLVAAIAATWLGGDAPGDALARRLGALVDAGGLADQHRRRRRLGDERERAVLVDRDLDGDDGAALRFGASVVLLAEVHDGQTMGAERGTDGRSRGGATGGDLDLDDGDDLFLGHDVSSFWK